MTIATIVESGALSVPVMHPHQLGDAYAAEGAPATLTMPDTQGTSATVGEIMQAVWEVLCYGAGILDRSLRTMPAGVPKADQRRVITLKPYEDLIVGSRFHNQYAHCADVRRRLRRCPRPSTTTTKVGCWRSPRSLPHGFGMRHTFMFPGTARTIKQPSLHMDSGGGGSRCGRRSHA